MTKKNNYIKLHSQKLNTLSELRVYRNGKLIGDFKSLEGASETLGIDTKATIRCILGLQKFHFGYSFEIDSNVNSKGLSPRLSKYVQRLVKENAPELEETGTNNYSQYVEHPKDFKMAGLAPFKMYRIDKKFINDKGMVKVYIVVETDRTFKIHVSLDSSTILGEGKLYDDDPTPLCRTEWNGRINMGDIIPEYVSDGGVFKVRLAFNWYEDSKPRVFVSQCVPKKALVKYNGKTLIGTADCRSHKVFNMKKDLSKFPSKGDKDKAWYKSFFGI